MGPMPRKQDKLPAETKQLLEKRRELIKTVKRNSIEYVEENKTVRKMPKQVFINYQTKQVQQLIEKNNGIKVLQRNNVPKKETIQLRNKKIHPHQQKRNTTSY